MRLDYPDFAFSSVTQVILFFVNWAVIALFYFWLANIILIIYNRKASFQQKMLFGVTSAICTHIVFVYGFALIFGMDSDLKTYQFLTKLATPFSYLILFFLVGSILKIPNNKSIRFMHMYYTYYLLANVLVYLAGVLLPQENDPRGWNYLRDIICLFIGLGFSYIIYIAMRALLRHHKPDVVLLITKDAGLTWRQLFMNFSICFVVYLLLLTQLSFEKSDLLNSVVLFLVFLAYFVTGIIRDYIKLLLTKLATNKRDIVVLTDSIQEFRGIKHDFGNILQTYSGYLAINDLDRLAAYHKKVTNTVVAAGTQLDLSQRLPENPTFFSLVIDKLERAKQCEAVVEVALCCDMKELYMEALDFNRAMAILLDNAIEAAAQTATKHIHLSSQLDQQGGKLIIVSNDTMNKVNAGALFEPGYTTKQGHMGQGLAQLQRILKRNPNVALNTTCNEGVFTVYLALMPLNLPGFPDGKKGHYERVTVP